MDNDKVQEMITAIGAVAEALGVFRHTLLQNEFEEEEVLVLCVEYLKVAIGGGRE